MIVDIFVCRVLPLTVYGQKYCKQNLFKPFHSSLTTRAYTNLSSVITQTVVYAWCVKVWRVIAHEMWFRDMSSAIFRESLLVTNDCKGSHCLAIYFEYVISFAKDLVCLATCA